MASRIACAALRHTAFLRAPGRYAPAAPRIAHRGGMSQAVGAQASRLQGVAAHPPGVGLAPRSRHRVRLRVGRQLPASPEPPGAQAAGLPRGAPSTGLAGGPGHTIPSRPMNVEEESGVPNRATDGVHQPLQWASLKTTQRGPLAPRAGVPERPRISARFISRRCLSVHVRVARECPRAVGASGAPGRRRGLVTCRRGSPTLRWAARVAGPPSGCRRAPG